MNIAAARWVVLLALAVASVNAAPADADYEEYEDEAPVAPVKPLRPSPLLRQARGPAIGRPAPKTAVTPKPTTEAAPALEYEDEEYADEVPAEEPVTTTTEAPKKGGLRTGVVRPFRSNADLIEALKRRRQQLGSGGSSASSAPSTTTASPTSSSDKSYKPGRRGGSKGSGPADQTGSNSERLSTVNNNSRRFSTRGRTTEAPAEPEQEEEQPTRPRNFGRGRRF